MVRELVDVEVLVLCEHEDVGEEIGFPTPPVCVGGCSAH